MFKRITILIFIIGIIFLINGLWVIGCNNIRSGKLDLREKEVITAEDYWSDSMVMFRYNTTRLKVKDLEEDLKDMEYDYGLLTNEVLAGKLTVKYSENIVALLADYIVFMQQLCDANGLIYPALVVEE